MFHVTLLPSDNSNVCPEISLQVVFTNAKASTLMSSKILEIFAESSAF
jgi:hypothetical protein